MHQHSLFCDIIVFIALNLQIIDLDKGRENNLIVNGNNGIIFQVKSVINIKATKNGGLDYADSDALYPIKEGQKNIISIEYSGI